MRCRRQRVAWVREVRDGRRRNKPSGPVNRAIADQTRHYSPSLASNKQTGLHSKPATTLTNHSSHSNG